MEKPWSLKNISLTVLFWSLAFNVYAQQWVLKDSIPLSDAYHLQIDQGNNIYCLQERTLFKYSLDSSVPLVSFKSVKPILSVEVLTEHKLFLVYHNSVLPLNKQLSPIGEEIFFEHTPLAIDGQQNIYLFNEFSNDLIKKDLITRQKVMSIKIDTKPRQLVLQGKRMILKYDRYLLAMDDFGKEKSKSQLNENDIVDTSGNKYTLINGVLFDNQTAERISLMHDVIAVAKSNEYLAVSSGHKIYIYVHKK